MVNDKRKGYMSFKRNDNGGFTFRSGAAKKTSYSSFWNDNDSSSVDELLGLETEKKKGKDPIELASHKRAISNFCNILTGKSIPVKFQGSDSYTDGKTITISSTINEKNFDPTVGLALHEASHILKSDFDFLKNLEYNIPSEIFVLAEAKGISKYEAIGHVKNLLNYVEDRRIDYFVFKTSPGYKGYYHEMYKKYFYSKVIDKMLLSSEMRELKWESYEARIINLHNKNTQLSSLPGLKEIYSIIDFSSISRLKSSEEACNVALDVYRVILRNIDVIETEKSEEQESLENIKDALNGGDSDESDGNSGSSEFSGNESGNGSSTDFNPSSNDDGSEAPELTDNQKKQLVNAMKKQEKFMDGDIQKTKASKKLQNDVEAINSSGATYEDVGSDITRNHWDQTKVGGTKCLVVKKLTKALIDTDQFSVCSSWNGNSYSNYEKYNFVEEGMRLGNMLGRKLQVRGEESSLKFTRKDSGRLDKRLINELGFGNSNVFSQTFVTKYNKAYLHISVDASGSMGGSNWNNAMTSAIAMIKAADMVGNIDVVMSVRTTHDSRQSNGSVPLIMVCYDSRTDKLSKVRSLFKYLNVTGTTPEGLCFEAIMKDLIPGNSNQDSYFINYSDGAPYYGNGDIYYSGYEAEMHTRKMVTKMRNMGMKVMSYFIGGDYSYGGDTYKKAFKTMYGNDASFIKATNMMDVARTMNKKFLDR
jgi:hypothetical protein